jgi:CHAD domain-containing protein
MKSTPKVPIPLDGSGRSAKPVSAPAAGTLPAVTLDYLERSLKKRWKRHRKELKRCQHDFSESAIHDARVEARRLLSTMELLGGFIPAARVRKIERAIKLRLGVFDELRDTQVQLPIVRKMLRTFPAARPFHDHLVKHSARLARQTRKRIKEVKTGRLDKLLAACRDDVDAARKQHPAGKAAARVLHSVDRAFDRVEHLRKAIDPRRPRTIHRTRVAFKKFRYMVEMLAGCLPGATDKLLAAMHQYQTLMGRIQDADILLQALDKFLGRKKRQPAAVGRLREELLRRRDWSIKIYMGAADELDGFWPLPTTAGAAPVRRGKPGRSRPPAPSRSAG